MARHDHPPVGIERPDRLGEQTDGVAHVAALNPITGVGFPELLLPVGQVGLQIELVAELPCESALVWLEGLDDIGRVRLQELGRPASLDSPAAIRFPHVIWNGRINPEKARNQADLQLLGIGRQPGESQRYSSRFCVYAVSSDAKYTPQLKRTIPTPFRRRTSSAANESLKSIRP